MKRSLQETSISDSNKKMKCEEEEEVKIVPEVMIIPFKNLDEDFQKLLKRSVGPAFFEIPGIVEILERNDNKIWVGTKRPLSLDYYMVEQVLVQYSKNHKKRTILEVKFSIDDDDY